MFWSRKWSAIAVAMVAPLSLSGCLILPGEFTSEMTVRRSGDFSFSYKGQIQLVGIASLMNSGAFGDTPTGEFKAACWNDSAADAAIEPSADQANDDVAQFTKPEATFALLRESSTYWMKPSVLQKTGEPPVTDEKTADADQAEPTDEKPAVIDDWQMTERECSTEETAIQKDAWEAQREASKKRDEQSKKVIAMMLGGIDPEDPATIKRFTKEVERLAAWNKVEHLGNGVFLVDYSTKGKLADDFAFPVIPRYALGEPMIHVTRWDNGRLRVEAPAFKTDPELSMIGLLAAGGMSGFLGSAGGESGKKMPEPLAIKGMFTLHTDAPILANNTEDGPEEVGEFQVLRWDIGPASYGAPMAMLKLVQ